MGYLTHAFIVIQGTCFGSEACICMTHAADTPISIHGVILSEDSYMDK
jgi:hypothetical protein